MIKRNDRHDVDPWELKLIRAGQHVAKLAQKAPTVSESDLLWEAAEIVWNAKKAYRIELAEKRKLKGEQFAARMRSK